MSHPYDMGDKKKLSVLGPTLSFKGELSASEDLLIQGQVEGSINHTSNLTIGENGKVKANIRAEHISVEGTVEGDLIGTTSVVVKETSNVTGNIISPTVTLREGSKFNGQIDMSGKEKVDARTRDEQVQAEEASNEDSASPEKAEAGNSDGKKQEASAA